ncbi:MAG TPA: hypothetical protein VNW90_02010 [Acetobacteraceae bacterium]|jgi:hypothetical protein|nr:hypothetical protein [Acetobacteraceae bacterium]
MHITEALPQLPAATVAALRPIDAAQALLAAQIVGAHFHAMDRLRAAAQPGQPVKDILRRRSEAIAMMRRMHSGLAALLRMQAARGKPDVAVHPAVIALREGHQTAPAVRPTHNLVAPRRSKLRPVH